MSRSELRAWAAGYLEADGSFTVSNRLPMLNIKHNVPDPGSPVPEPLARFHEAIDGLGKVGGPYRQKNRKWPFRMWHGRSDTAVAVMKLLWPYMTERGRQRWLDIENRARRAAAQHGTGRSRG